MGVKSVNLISALENAINPKLASDLVNEFIQIRQDCKTSTFGRSAPGKFVETVVQTLQLLESGSFSQSPKVDEYLRNLDSSSSKLNDDLRITCARIARSCYTLRNKRNIAHKGSIVPNIYDLNYIYSSAQWIMSELVRQLLNHDVVAAAKIIEFIQIPVSPIVESLGDRKLVHGNYTVEHELIILLHSDYPIPVQPGEVLKSMDRRSKSSVYKSLRKLWRQKFLHKDSYGYLLTQEGYKYANIILLNSNEKSTR